MQHEVDIRLRLPNGDRVRERRRSPVCGLANTQSWAESRERELLLSASALAERRLGPTLAEFEPKYIAFIRAARQKHSTILFKESAIRAWIVPQLGDRKLGELSDGDVYKLSTAMAIARSSRKHVNNVLTTLSAMIHAAIKLRLINASPCTIEVSRTTAQEPAFYSFDEYARLVEAGEKFGGTTYLLVLLGGDAGLRPGEMLALEHTDIDHHTGLVSVQRAEYRGVVDTSKQARDRRVPMTQRLAAALQASPRLGGRVLIKLDGRQLTHKILSKLLMHAERQAGLRVAGNLDMLRHTFCSHLAMRGASLQTIRELAGHAHLSTTQRYAHLSPLASDEEAIALLQRGARGDSAIRDSKNFEKPRS